MNRGTYVRSLAALDIRLVGRDRFLIGVGLWAVSMSLAIRFVVPGIREALLAGRGFDLMTVYPLLASYLSVFLGPMLAGMIFGFTLLEAREDRTLRAILVSPLPLPDYVRYRIMAPTVLSAVLVPTMAVLVGISLPGPGALLAISLVGSLMGPVWALTTATCADNKVSAFALLKGLSATGLIIIASFFLETPLQYTAGVYPPYWLAKAYWTAAAGEPWWPFLAVALAYLVILNRFLAKRLIRVCHR